MKKLIFVSTLLLGIIFTNNVSFAEDSKIINTSKIDTNGLFDKYVKLPFNNLIKNMDEFRMTIGGEFQKKVDEYKNKKDVILANQETVQKKIDRDLEEDNLDKTQSYFSSSKGNPISLTWITILIYVFTFLSYIFITAYIFYLLFGLVLFLILRFIWTYLL